MKERIMRRVIALRLQAPQKKQPVVDPEFLPAALAMLDTPPSPVRMHLISAICLLFALTLVASWIGRIDIYAVAQARLQPVGRTKVIQPLVTGKVRSIHVQNGTSVRRGQLLLELDPTESAADQAANAAQEQMLRAQIARRRAAIDAATQHSLVATEIAFDPQIDPAVRVREQAIFAADLAELRATLATLDAKIAERETQRKALDLTISKQQQLVDTLEQRVDMQRSLLVRQLASRVSVIDAEQEHGEAATLLASQMGERLQADAAVQSLRSESAFEMNRFVAENSEALAQAQSRHDDVAQSLVKANARVEQTRLTAPLDGVVQQVVVTTVGQVVTTGQPLMIIVPQGATLEAEALVQNRDIGFIEPGQRVTLKLDAFPFTRYGTLTGRIARVSSDAVSSREAAAAGDPTVAALHLGTIPSVTDSYVYTVTIVLDSAMMVIDGRPMLLTPGMSATAQIRTGERRLLEYFLGPLLENASNAGHER
jgi:hemolysin D